MKLNNIWDPGIPMFNRCASLMQLFISKPVPAQSSAFEQQDFSYY